jgi:DNA helicase-2/ATP-dependent DNA helicase PcrA
MAVLYRSHFHALELQLELTRHNIPFSITSGIRFFEQAHIKDLTAYLKLVHNPRDELSFKRLALMLPGVGAKAAHKLWLKITDSEELRLQAGEGKPAGGGQSVSLRPPPPSGHNEQVRAELGNSPRPLAARLQQGAAVPKKAAAAWAQFIATIAQLEADDVRNSASKMIELALDAGYEDYLKENYANHLSRLDDLEQLAVFARQFQAVEDFLTQLALLTNVEAEAQDRPNRDDEQLRLSTIHQAKGLEFDVVFVIMLCEGLFPSRRSLQSLEGLEEERRLMYVSITRARNELYLSYPLVRAAYGGGDYIQQPSRFLSEIPKELLDEWNLRLH